MGEFQLTDMFLNTLAGGRLDVGDRQMYAYQTRPRPER